MSRFFCAAGSPKTVSTQAQKCPRCAILKDSPGELVSQGTDGGEEPAPGVEAGSKKPPKIKGRGKGKGGKTRRGRGAQGESEGAGQPGAKRKALNKEEVMARLKKLQKMASEGSEGQGADGTASGSAPIGDGAS